MLVWVGILVFAYAIYFIVSGERKKKQEREMRLNDIRRKIKDNTKKKKNDGCLTDSVNKSV